MHMCDNFYAQLHSIYDCLNIYIIHAFIVRRLDFFCIKFTGTEQSKKVQDILSHAPLLRLCSSHNCNNHARIWLETDGNYNPRRKPLQYRMKFYEIFMYA